MNDLELDSVYNLLYLQTAHANVCQKKVVVEAGQFF